MFGLGRKRKTEEDELLKPQEVSKLLRCSLSWIYAASDKGVLPSVRIPPLTGKGKMMVRFKKTDVWKLVERHYET